MRLFLGILVICLLLPAQARAQDFSQVTTNLKIITTLNLLSNHNELSKKTFNTILGENLSRQPMKVMFYDLSAMNIAFEKYDALTCKHKNGSYYILINKIHKNAPVEALACILAHEAHHQDEITSYQEEIAAWTSEAILWESFKKEDKDLRDSSLNAIPLVKRLNAIQKMYVTANYSSELISEKVHKNAGYKGLPEYSPGYGI